METENGTPRVPDAHRVRLPRVGVRNARLRARALGLLAATAAGVHLGFLGGGPRRRNREDCGEGRLEDDVLFDA